MEVEMNKGVNSMDSDVDVDPRLKTKQQRPLCIPLETLALDFCQNSSQHVSCIKLRKMEWCNPEWRKVQTCIKRMGAHAEQMRDLLDLKTFW